MVTAHTDPDALDEVVLILGCGFTGQRVAKRLLARGSRVIGTTRDPENNGFDELRRLGARILRLDEVTQYLQDLPRERLTVLHSIPPGGPDVGALLAEIRPARVVYLSSTAVYGDATEVDEQTGPDGSADRSRARLQAEEQIRNGPWSTLVLRPAAIYGPGRGVQVSFPRGEYRVGDNYISRIHVDDLAAQVEAALHANVTGVYPVADEEAATSLQMATFCAKLLGLPSPDPASIFTASAARVTGNRRVDGSAIRELLGVTLKYPSYRTGIPASLMNPPRTNDTL